MCRQSQFQAKTGHYLSCCSRGKSLAKCRIAASANSASIWAETFALVSVMSLLVESRHQLAIAEERVHTGGKRVDPQSLLHLLVVHDHELEHLAQLLAAAATEWREHHTFSTRQRGSREAVARTTRPPRNLNPRVRRRSLPVRRAVSNQRRFRCSVQSDRRQQAEYATWSWRTWRR